MKKLLILGLGALWLTSAALPAAAFERVGDRKFIVFGGRQQVPVLDPHVRYDWSTRMRQQAVYDALAKYVGNPAKVVPWLAESWDSSPDARPGRSISQRMPSSITATRSMPRRYAIPSNAASSSTRAS